MGIQGLTTFIQNRSHLYMEKYELHDTNVVLDGHSVAYQLYKLYCNSNDCFGGDYDKYAKTISTFFQSLSECNVTPYVVFDGGYESRKIATILSRMKKKIKAADRLNSVTEGRIPVFPLFVTATFEDMLSRLNIPRVRCDFESDTETANIARTLSCPVISYDSDYFIFDVLYVPFSTIDLVVRKKKKPDSNESYSYIQCEIYRVEKFLNYFGGMDKRNLPVLAVLLGNDYVKKSEFSLFYNHLKMQKCHGNQNEQQKIIKSLIVWLQNETVESALKKVLSRYKTRKRRLIACKIYEAMKGYNYGNCEYLKYLEISDIKSANSVDINIDEIVMAIDEGEDESIEEETEEEIKESKSDSEEDDSIEESSEVTNISNCNPKTNINHKYNTVSSILVPENSLFRENFRKCNFPACFMDMVLENKYYCIPQVENSSEKCSHFVSTEILSAIHKILTKPNNSSLICLVRNEHNHVQKYPLPQCDIDIPNLQEIFDMDANLRKKLLLRIFGMNEIFIKNCLSMFSETWHLFIITLKYLSDKSALTWPLTFSLILCKIVLSYVDNNIGFYRKQKSFDKKFGSIIDKISKEKESKTNNLNTILESLNAISFNDSLMCLKALIPYFSMDGKMKSSYKLFDRSLVHSMAQFQSCFLHIKYLNALLNFPYPNFIISEFFSGTLVYNLTTNFMKRPDLNAYVKILLNGSPSVINSLVLIIDVLQKYFSSNISTNVVKRRRKNKKSKITETEIIDNEEEPDETNSVFDPHNKFSILSLKSTSQIM